MKVLQDIFTVKLTSSSASILHCHISARLKQSIMKLVFWYVKPRSLIDIYQSFDGNCCLHLHNGKHCMDLGQESGVGL